MFLVKPYHSLRQGQYGHSINAFVPKKTPGVAVLSLITEQQQQNKNTYFFRFHKALIDCKNSI
jgi:hypothetical protein